MTQSSMSAHNDPRANKVLKYLREKRSSFWEKERVRYSLSLFHRAARGVHAYGDFLKKNHIAPEKIRTIKDFQFVPPVNKKEYLRRYPLEKLIWSSAFQKGGVFTTTSGSTGSPFYFPRGASLDWQSSIYHEAFLWNKSVAKGGSTLVIVGFGMGVWIGGLITYQAFRYIFERGAAITILTPGANKNEIWEAMRHIAGNFDQVILCGYPPFIKDVIDEGGQNGIRWKQFNMRIIFAAEIFSERFRQYISTAAGIHDIYRDTMSIYGSADLGTMATETPISILVRRAADKNPALRKRLFGPIEITPTLTQFNPFFINFESIDGNILCTGDNTIPLIRYEIGDHGGIIPFSVAESLFAEHGNPISRISKACGLRDVRTELPFVYLYERADFSIKLYGAIIYPEHIKEILLHPTLAPYITGKFSMEAKHSTAHEEHFELNIELRKGKVPKAAFEKQTSNAIIKNLIEKNAEYRYLYNMMPRRVVPHIKYWRYSDPTYFQAGTKQQWIKTNKK